MLKRLNAMLIGNATLVVLIGLSGCGDDDGGGGNPAPSATPTLAATVTPTATQAPDEHSEVIVGSTLQGGGRIKGEYDYDDHVHLDFAFCIGGSGDDCAGGTEVYSAVNPGFESLEEDEPAESHFTLPQGTAIRLSILSIDSGLSLKLGSAVADAAGESLQLGEVEFHADVEAQIVVEPFRPKVSRQVTFELSAPGGGYETSEPYTLTFEPESD